MTDNLELNTIKPVDCGSLAANTVYDDAKAAGAGHTLQKEAAGLNAQNISGDARTDAHKDVPDIKIAAHEAGLTSKRR